jgi:hypothetical protein
MMDETAARAGAAAIFAGIVIAGYLIYRLLGARAQVRMKALFTAYFHGEMTADELGRRARTLPGSRYLMSSELLALATAAFQSAVDERLGRKAHSAEDADRLMKTLAALKLELGLPDLYRTEGWRPGRE